MGGSKVGSTVSGTGKFGMYRNHLLKVRLSLKTELPSWAKGEGGEGRGREGRGGRGGEGRGREGKCPIVHPLTPPSNTCTQSLSSNTCTHTHTHTHTQ